MVFTLLISFTGAFARDERFGCITTTSNIQYYQCLGPTNTQTTSPQSLKTQNEKSNTRILKMLTPWIPYALALALAPALVLP